MNDEQIEKAVKQLAKESTAPDKDTPDWLEADIRRGMKWMQDQWIAKMQAEIEGIDKRIKLYKKKIKEFDWNDIEESIEVYLMIIQDCYAQKQALTELLNEL